MTYNTGDDLFGVARWIVDPVAGYGTQTTIQAAITAASSGQTVFIRPGTYTETLTLKAGVNLTAFGSDSSLNGTGDVIINGISTLTAAGSVTISGIQLQTNSAAFLAVTGSAASVVNLNNCYLNCSNNTGITFSSSSASSAINLNNCYGNLGTTGIGLFTNTSAGMMKIIYSIINNTGASTTASTTSTANVTFFFSSISFALSSSSTGSYSIDQSVVDTTLINTIGLTTVGTGVNTIYASVFASGTASSISVGVGTTISIDNCTIASSNTNVITGAGTLNPSGLSLPASKAINVTTQVGGVLPGGVFQAPSAGFIGEEIRSYATGVNLTNATPTNITSISLTPGIWSVSAVGDIASTGISSSMYLGLSPTSATLVGNSGDQYVLLAIPGLNNTTIDLCVPSFRVTTTTTINYYLVEQITFSTGTASGQGRISAIRVG